MQLDTLRLLALYPALVGAGPGVLSPHLVQVSRLLRPTPRLPPWTFRVGPSRVGVDVDLGPWGPPRLCVSLCRILTMPTALARPARPPVRSGELSVLSPGAPLDGGTASNGVRDRR